MKATIGFLNAFNPLGNALSQIDAHPDDRCVLERIARKFSHVDENGCVFISGTMDSNGRPRIGWLGRRHRVARVIVAIRDELLLYEDWKWDTRHLCHNRACVNPDHLMHGTRQENSDDCVEAGRAARGKMHGRSKLSEQQASDIIKDTRPHQVIADELGIARQTVSKIKSGERWAHLHEEAAQ
ncbi:HNH endonuclease [Ruegeria atlantica]|uniref:HNH endonuclease n=1 Tax=Ruegeria atlantica TaxID=81569 RepID=UPI00147AF81B|nr:HNH endonuclease [Ruegeria atlantica]